MEYFAGLDISMDETHICVLDREGAVVYESKTISTAEAMLTSWPRCRVAVGSCSRLDVWRRSCFTG